MTIYNSSVFILILVPIFCHRTTKI